MSARKAKLLITERALKDFADIEAYSEERWGKRVAAKYLRDFEQALQRIQENIELLSPDPDFHDKLCFYRVNKHLFVCDIHEGVIYLITVIQASRDIPARLSQLQPTLAAEIDLLRKKLPEKKKH